MGQVVITGGSGGLGSAMAEVFGANGYEVDAPGSRELDVTDPVAVAGYLAGRSVDLLVCCAGMILDAPLFRLAESDWDRTLAVNFTGASDCARAVIPGMVEQGSGHIIFISSYSALHPPVGQAAYSSAKAALLGFTEDLACRYGSENIRVNAVLPGFLQTKMTESVTLARRGQILSEHCLGRFNTPAAAAGFVHYLHHQMPHTSGQIFQLDNRP